MIIDVNAFIGAHPFDHFPPAAPRDLLRAMDRVGIERAWVTNLPDVFRADPASGNDSLIDALASEPRLEPIPAVDPGRPGWRAVVEGMSRVAVAIRCDPTWHGLDPAGLEMTELAEACGDSQFPLVLAVRLEDARQRDPGDRSPELPPWAVRHLLRSDARVRLVVTHAQRPFIEEVHFGSTPQEAARVWWDISWLWGPPEDQLQLLVRTVGAERLVFGTGQPLRLPEGGIAKMDLVDAAETQRNLIYGGNIKSILAPGS